MKPVKLTIPYIDREVEWHNGNLTNIIGMNGAGKTLLLQEMMDYCDTNGITYVTYNAITALNDAKYILEYGNDEDIIYAAKMMMHLSIDFKDDMFCWAKAMNGHSFDNMGDYRNNIKIVKHVLSMCGAGYTRLFVITHNAVKAMGADYYFLDLPETSLHINLARHLTDYLLMNFKYTKMVMATHSPEVVSFHLDREHLISL